MDCLADRFREGVMECPAGQFGREMILTTVPLPKIMFSKAETTVAEDLEEELVGKGIDP